jgi:rhodanese-related sulfurtransferase
MTSNIIIPVLLALAVGLLLLRSGGDVKSADAHRLVEAGARLVDVRTPQEFASGHLPGAVNVPVQELDRRMGELPEKERPIVLYCRSGARSSSAARMLKSAGYTEVHDLGAMSRW